MSVELFRDDNQGHATSLAANSRGYVLNIQRILNPSDARLHQAACLAITGTPTRDRTLTGSYAKACSLSRQKPDGQAPTHAMSAIVGYGIRQPIPTPQPTSWAPK